MSAVRPRNQKNLGRVSAAIAVALCAVLAWNATVFIPASSVLQGAADVSAVVYRRWLVSPSEIVFDIRSVRPTASMVIVDRQLFNVAEKLKGHHFKNIVLASKGTAQLLLDGDHFREIGEERSSQNPIYMIRTLQEHVKNLDGSDAFQTRQGGLLGVLGGQMQDHNNLHMQWWIRPFVGEVEPDNRTPPDFSKAP